MSDENWDLEAGSGFQPGLERVDKPTTIIELDSSDSQDFSETNDTAKTQQCEAPVSFHPADHETENSEYKAKRLSPQRSGTPKKESSKSDHDVKNYESMVRGRDDVDRRRGRSDRWGLSSGANEERRGRDGFPPRDGRNSSPYHGRHEEEPSPRRHRSPNETTISNQVATREPVMSRDSESKVRCEMRGSAVNSSESKRGADQCPGRSTDSPPSPDMDDRRHRVSRSISPRGDRGRLRRKRSRSKSRSRSRSRSPYSSRHSDRKPPAGQVCRDFLAGRCRRGLQCRFSHQDSTSYSRYSSPLEYPKEGGREKDRDRERERDRDRERERDRDREKEIGRDIERYPTKNDRENLYDSKGQTEYSRDRQSSQGYRTTYDEPPYHGNSKQSSERCLDFSKGRCTRGENCRFVHHEASSGHGGWGMRDVETKRGWDERESDGVSRSRVATFDDREKDISLDSERDKRAKGKEICKFFLEGRCGRGQGCRFSHEVGNVVHGEDASEQSWSNKMRDDMHSGGGTLNAYAVQPQSYTGQAQVPPQPLLSFYPANQNPVNPNPVNQSLVNMNTITGGTTATVLGSVLGHPIVNSYTSVRSNPNHNISGYNLHGQTMGTPDNITQSMLGLNPDKSLPAAPPPPVSVPDPNPSNMLTSEQAANIDVKSYLSQILANNPEGSTSIPSIPPPAQPGKNPAPPHESPVTPPVERKFQEVQKEEDGLGHKPRRRSTPNPKLSKETKGVKLFKCALVEVVKHLLKPSWKEGQLSREAHKTIVKKVVDKVTGTMEEGTVPQTQEKIDIYLSHSKSKLSKLVQAYVGKYVKPVGN